MNDTMNLEEDILSVVERIRGFLKINQKVYLLDLKLHLGCRESELLLALGWMLRDGSIQIKREGWRTLIIKSS
jgi:hypothetical protein